VDETQKRVTALFDKYKPADFTRGGRRRQTGRVITADDIISVLRQK